jgi:16S rRNA (cytosine1402-N4)-methyltransferase
MDPTQGIPASLWLESVSSDRLKEVLRNYGEVKYPGRIARVIKERLPMTTTLDLADAVVAAVPGGPRKRAHPARRTFQAIRIAVNEEFEKIEAGLSYALQRLVIGGRIAAITFHSGEDRVVKRLFRDHAQARGSAFKLVNKKPIAASTPEAESNPRARSAKLRVIERVF